MLDNVASLRWFLPELILGATVCVLLAVDLLAPRPDRQRAAIVGVGGLLMAVVLTLFQMDGAPRGLFGGLVAKDPFTDFFKLIFLGSAIIVGVAALRTRDAIEYKEGDTQNRESGEFYGLVLSSVVGMSLMAAATDLLMAYLSLEFVSMMSFILAGWKRRDRKSSEAALKYVVYGGVASGVMLYGMSLLYGLAGSTNMTAIAAAVAAAPSRLMVIASVTLVLAGFGYKIAAVPFHMWCPDVYEGAPTAVTAFLSVGPKAAGFALLIRFFAGAVPHVGQFADGTGPWPALLGTMAAATMTLGNFAAISQSNVKRMLAYSSIAHAGYLLLGLCPQSADGVRAILLYLVTYLFMNLGAFLVVMAASDAGLGENISDYKGFGYRAPLAGVVMTVCLVSLTGLPPLAGFFGKFYLFAALIQRGGPLLIALALIAILNSAISLYYYARLLKAMYFEKPAEGATLISPAPVHTAGILVTGIATAALFVVWPQLVRLATDALTQWYPPVAAAMNP